MMMVEYFRENGVPVIIKAITEPIKEIMDEALPGAFRYEHDRDMYDYVYLTQDLINLKGRKYQKNVIILTNSKNDMNIIMSL